MRFLNSLGFQAFCFSLLALAACSGDDNAAPPSAGGSAGAAGSSAGSSGSGGGVAGSSTTDSGNPDVSSTRDGAGDATSEEAGPLNCPSLPGDGGASDAGGAGDAGDSGSSVGIPPAFVFPMTLSATGLFCDIATKVIAPANKLFRPKYELWSDGAAKTRWVYLPPGTKVDTTSMDHWSMPVGARFWKEFKFAGKRVETRLIVRVASGGATDFAFASYKWNTAESEATLVDVAGEKNVAPITPEAGALLHDIPSEAECGQCHGRLPERILGFSAVQLTHNLMGENLTTLAAANLLSVPPASAAGYPVPGNNVQEPALGFLHANCGNCHNETATGVTNPKFVLRVLTTDTTVDATFTYRTAVNIPHTWMGVADAGLIGGYRAQGGNAGKSEIHYRMSIRGVPGQQMPPIDTKIPTSEGMTIVDNWINSLPPPPDAGDGG